VVAARNKAKLEYVAQDCADAAGRRGASLAVPCDVTDPDRHVHRPVIGSCMHGLVLQWECCISLIMLGGSSCYQLHHGQRCADGAGAVATATASASLLLTPHGFVR
jgi:hypothetical protein